MKKIKIFIFSFIFVVATFSFIPFGRCQLDDNIDDVWISEAGIITEKSDQYDFMDMKEVEAVDLVDEEGFSILKIGFNGKLDFNDTEKQFLVYVIEDVTGFTFDPVNDDPSKIEYLFRFFWDDDIDDFDIRNNDDKKNITSISVFEKLIEINSTFKITDKWGFITFYLLGETYGYDFLPDSIYSMGDSFTLFLIIAIVSIGIVSVIVILLVLRNRRRFIRQPSFRGFGRQPSSQFQESAPIPIGSKHKKEERKVTSKRRKK